MGDLEAMVLSGGTVVELDPPRVERADVTIEAGRIRAVGPARKKAGDTHVDVSGCLVLPAFAVGHTHLYSSLACGMPSPTEAPRTFHEILERVWWKLDRALDDELVSVSALVGAVTAAKHGVASVIDHHASPNAIDGSLDRIAAALDQVGLRGALCYETSDRDGKERRDAALRENERFARGTKPSHHVGLVGAHAPFTLGDDTLDALRDLAQRAGTGIHVHVAEGPDDALDAKARGIALVDRLRRMGVARPRSIVAHAVHLDEAAITEMTEAGAWIVTNARSNMNNAVGLASAGGARIALGTDGIGADMIAEAQAHFFRHAEARDGLASDAITRLAGAQRLGAFLLDKNEATPRIAAGARADLVVLAYDPATPLDATNLGGHALFGWSSRVVRDTIVGGRFVVRDRVVQTLDEAALLARARVQAKRLWDRLTS